MVNKNKSITRFELTVYTLTLCIAGILFGVSLGSSKNFPTSVIKFFTPLGLISVAIVVILIGNKYQNLLKELDK